MEQLDRVGEWTGITEEWTQVVLLIFQITNVDLI